MDGETKGSQVTELVEGHRAHNWSSRDEVQLCPKQRQLWLMLRKPLVSCEALIKGRLEWFLAWGRGLGWPKLGSVLPGAGGWGPKG